MRISCLCRSLSPPNTVVHRASMIPFRRTERELCSRRIVAKALLPMKSIFRSWTNPLLRCHIRIRKLQISNKMKCMDRVPLAYKKLLWSKNRTSKARWSRTRCRQLICKPWTFVICAIGLLMASLTRKQSELTPTRKAIGRSGVSMPSRLPTSRLTIFL